MTRDHELKCFVADELARLSALHEADDQAAIEETLVRVAGVALFVDRTYGRDGLEQMIAGMRLAVESADGREAAAA